MADDDKKPPAEEPKAPQSEEPAKKLTKEEKKAQAEEFKKTSTVRLKVYSPFRVYYDDDAESVSAENATGPFDILAQHRNFITLLVPCEIDVKSSKTGNKKIKINRGVMHVRQNKVTVFLDV